MRKESVIREWIISYMLVLMIPLMVIFVNYNTNVRIIRKEILHAHMLILDNLKISIDKLLEGSREMYFYFWTNAGFRNLIDSPDMDKNFYYNAYQFRKELGEYSSISKNTDCFIYIEDKDYIINSRGANHSHNIYNSLQLMDSSVLPYTEWKEFLCRDYWNKFLLCDMLYNWKPCKNLVYANSYTLYNSQKANVFVTIPLESFEIQLVKLPEGSIFTICFFNLNKNEEQETLLLTIDSEGIRELPDNISVDDMKGDRNYFNSGGYIGISTLSNEPIASYTLLIPEETFWKEEAYIRNIHLISLLLTLVVGICLMIVLVRRNFRPVANLLNIVGKKRNKGVNEFRQIEMAYVIMQNENTTMMRTLKTHEKTLMSNYLLSLLKGRIMRIKERELQMELGHFFCSGVFALISFYIPEDMTEDADYDYLTFFALDNIWSELMEDENFYYIEDGRFLHYLFCIPNGQQEEWKKKALEQGSYLCTYYEDKFHISITAAISLLERDISRVKYMYQDVMSAFEYKKITGGNGVIFAEELYDADDKWRCHSYHKLLGTTVENGNLEEARLVGTHLFQDIGHMPFEVLRFRALEAFQVIVDVYNDHITDSVKRMQLLSLLEPLMNADNEVKIRRHFDEILVFACEKISGLWKTESKSIVDSVKRYVDSNYAEPNLNISFIAEEIGKNPKYISKVFRDETNSGILDYINSLRIRKAQEILLTQSVSIEDVSLMVGYTSVRTFRRCFTKIVGILPNKYRENNQ